MRSRLTALAVVALAVAGTWAPSSAAAAGPRDLAPAGGHPQAARAGSSVNIGSIPTGGLIGCGSFNIGFQSGTPPTDPSYVVPFNGVVTAFTYTAGAAAGSVRAVFFVPGTTAGHFTLVGKSTPQAAVANTVNSYLTRVPVPAGAMLGSRVSSTSMACGYAPASPVVAEKVALGNLDPDTQTDLAAVTASTVLWNSSATVEPDVDGDGFGDVSQDLCPQSALTQAPCPSPETKFSSSPPKTGHNRNARFTFSSSVPGSTFLCSLDGGTFKACSSPLKRRLSYGKHNLRVKALSPVGIPDLSPASATFRITKPKPHHHHH